MFVKQLLLFAFLISSVFADLGNLNTFSVPKVLSPGKTVEVIRGQTIRLKCTIEYNPSSNYALIWRKGDSLLISNEYIVKAPENRTHVYSNGTNLEITNAVLQDEGEYVCSVTSTPQINQTHFVRVTYLDSISLMPDKPIDLRAGDRLLIKCSGVGYPTPRATWFLDENPVTDAKFLNVTGELIVEKVKTSHAGVYKCNLENGAGTMKTASVRVNVIESDRVIQKPENGEVTTNIDDTIKLSCTVEGQGKMKTKWFFKEAQLPHANTEELTISKVQPANAGEYICRIETEIYNNLEARFHVRVRHAPIVTCRKLQFHTGEGRSTDINCFVSADPLPEIMWMRNGVVLVSNDKISISADAHTKKYELKIRNLKKNDFGSYIILAENSLGKAQEKITISGLPRPVVVSPLDEVSTNTVLTFTTSSVSPIFTFLLNCTEFAPDGTVDRMEITIPAESSDLTYTQHFTLRCLKMNATYQIAMSATNDYGQSEWGPELNITVSDSATTNVTSKCIASEYSIPPESESSSGGEAAAVESPSTTPTSKSSTTSANIVAILTIVIVGISFW